MQRIDTVDRHTGLLKGALVAAIAGLSELGELGELAELDELKCECWFWLLVLGCWLLWVEFELTDDVK